MRFHVSGESIEIPDEVRVIDTPGESPFRVPPYLKDHTDEVEAENYVVADTDSYQFRRPFTAIVERIDEEGNKLWHSEIRTDTAPEGKRKESEPAPSKKQAAERAIRLAKREGIPLLRGQLIEDNSEQDGFDFDF